jgi:O-antigen ligase
MVFVAAPLAGPSAGAGYARSQTDSPAIGATVAWAAACALVLLAPFEALEPLVVLPWQSLSTVEAAIAGALATWGAVLVATRTRPIWRTPLTAPWLAFLAAMTLAAIFAPAHRGNALNMAGRLTLAFALYLLVVNGVTSMARLRKVLLAVAIAGAGVASLAILEYLGVDRVLRLLGAFRSWVALVGAQVRASGPLQYPTIASMFLEIAFAAVLGLLLLAVEERRVRYSLILVALAVAIVQGVVFTFTRSGLITLSTTLAVIAWLEYRNRGFNRGLIVLAIVSMLLVVQVLSSRSLEYLRLRMTTETMEAWFRAEIRGPARIDLRTGSRTTVPVRLRNTGGATWDSSAAQPFRLSYHWLRANEDLVVRWEGLRTTFPIPVTPGSSTVIDALVEAPSQPGEYRLMWDVEQVHRLWFSTEPDAPLFVTPATVTGPPTDSRPPATAMTLPRHAVRPGRQVLWAAAGSVVATRPFLGIGPDNYRLTYGEHAGLANFDRRIHSNNMYLEVLVGGGIVAALAFGWLCWAAARQSWNALQQSRMGAALAAATLAIALHGVVDSFLGFTPTYVLFSVVLGLTTAVVTLDGTHAHRV